MENQRKDNDKSLKSGERQVANSLDKIEESHIDRYIRACKYLLPQDIVLDLGGGCGYGANILSKKVTSVISIDDSPEAITYAKTHWQENNIYYFCKDVFEIKNMFGEIRKGEAFKAEVIVAFELIEHIKDTDKLFKLMGELAQKYIIFSVPSKQIPLKRSKWHWRHFDKEDILNYMNMIGFEIKELANLKDTWFVVAKRR